LGHKVSKEQREHLRKKMLGRIFTKEHKNKLSLAKLGKPSAKLGKKYV